jgi:hypothetical protein
MYFSGRCKKTFFVAGEVNKARVLCIILVPVRKSFNRIQLMIKHKNPRLRNGIPGGGIIVDTTVI